jgi:hypothetical protein
LVPQIEVRDVCVDTYPDYPGSLIFAIEYSSNALQIAIQIAQNYMKENVVEYGITFEGI